MGRYYSGDINGKFWFAVQGSDDASFFGGQESEPNYIEYYFSGDDIESVVEGIKKCEQALDTMKEKLDAFFEKATAYNDAELGKIIGKTEKETTELLGWYARLELGEKILKCLEQNGECQFQAEL